MPSMRMLESKESPKRFNLDTNFMPLNSRGKRYWYLLGRKARRYRAVSRDRTLTMPHIEPQYSSP
jgi:hypothetical protein